MKNLSLSKSSIISLIFFILISSYFFSTKQEIKVNFYYWESSFHLTNFEEKFLDKLKSKKLYVKIFDITYENSLRFIPTKLDKKIKYQVVPVIYIENRVFLKIEDIDKFIATAVEKILLRVKNLEVKEIQFDCDWSLKTKKNYFYFLKKVKKILRVPFSATIRLHQVKYHKKTGVPPIDYGVLMYYNMEFVGDFETKNSILNNTIAKRYHYNFDTYPIKLKLALPIYSQGVLFRYEEVVEIIEGVERDEFIDRNFAQVKSNRFKVLKSHYFKGRYIYKNDIIRFENSNFSELKEASREVAKLLKDVDEVIFYRIEDKYLKRIGYENLQDIVSSFN